MAKQVINIGASPNDGTGDFVRDAFDKTNDNFTELYNGKIVVELMDATTVVFYAPNIMSIDSITNILNAPTITITVGGLSYTLGGSIPSGSEIEINASTASVIQLNITNS